MSLPTPDAILFDLDGTLVDSIADLASAANAVRLYYGLSPHDEATIRGFIGDGARKLLARSLADGPEVEFDEAFAVFRAHYAAHCLDRTVCYPGVLETLDALLPMPMAVVSNKPQAFTETVARGLGIADRCAVVVGARPGVPVKPDPALLDIALAQFPVRPRAPWMVGDSLNDVRSGRAIGATTVAVTYGLGASDALAAEAPDATIDRFEGLLALCS